MVMPILMGMAISLLETHRRKLESREVALGPSLISHPATTIESGGRKSAADVLLPSSSSQGSVVAHDTGR